MRRQVDIRSMGRRADYWWQVLADALAPLLDAALWVRFLFKEEERVSAEDSYYCEPPEALTREAYSHCQQCDTDTLHEFVKWQPYGEGTAQCLTCGDIWDVDWSEE